MLFRVITVVIPVSNTLGHLQIQNTTNALPNDYSPTTHCIEKRVSPNLLLTAGFCCRRVKCRNRPIARLWLTKLRVIPCNIPVTPEHKQSTATSAIIMNCYAGCSFIAAIIQWYSSRSFIVVFLRTIYTFLQYCASRRKYKLGPVYELARI